MSIDMAQFHQVFFEESFEGLDVMENGLLNMDPGEIDPEEINSIFRAAHSIKGGSGTFGFTNVSEFTHVMETLLDEMRDGRRPVTGEAVNVLLASVDVLREMLTAAQDGGEPDEERVKEQHAELTRVLANAGASDGPAADAGHAAVAGGEFTQVEPVGWKIVFRPHQHLLRTGNDPLRIIRELGELGELAVICDTSELPPLNDLEPEDSYLSWELHLNEPVAKEEIDEIFEWIEDDCDFAVIPLLPEGYESATPTTATAEQAAVVADEAPPAPALKVLDPPPERRVSEDRRKEDERRKPSPGGKSGAGGSSIRVDTGKIDSLINMVGELVITQSMLGMLGEEFSMDKLARLPTPINCG